MNDPDLPDSMTVEWPSGLCAEQISRYMTMQAQNNINFDIAVTFDKYGVSGHTNHMQTFKGVMQVLREQKYEAFKKVLSLKSVNIVRKYIGLMDAQFMNPMDYQLCTLNPMDTFNSLAMHDSQFVWFRKLFVVFSRYTWWNSFDVYKLTGTTLTQENN